MFVDAGLPEVWPPLLTPFTDNGDIDYPALSRLIEFYVENCVTGLLVLGLSGEPLELTAVERLELVSYVARRIAGRIRFTVAAMGGDTGMLAEQGKAFVDAGAEATVLLASQLVPSDSSDMDLATKLMEVAEAMPGNIGIYEAPLPYKLVLGKAAFKVVTESGRFVFMKDTCQDEKMMRVRGAACRDVALLNAETYSLRESIALGYSGFCGLTANLYPDLIGRVMDLSDLDGPEISQLLTIADAALEKSYPSSAKFVLSENRNLKFSSFSRRLGGTVNPRDLTSILSFDEYIRSSDLWQDRQSKVSVRRTGWRLDE